MPADWLPFLNAALGGIIVAAIGVVGTWLKGRQDRDTKALELGVTGSLGLLTQLRETEKYLRERLQALEDRNSSLQQENILLKGENADLKRDMQQMEVRFNEQLAAASMRIEEGALHLREARAQIDAGERERDALARDVARLRAKVEGRAD